MNEQEKKYLDELNKNRAQLISELGEEVYARKLG